MPRVLIVSPHFPPVNAPDMQRVRMSLPHFVAADWDVTVLAADDPHSQAPLDAGLLATIPPEVRVVRLPTLSRRWTRRVGLNNVGWRVWPALARTGAKLLARERFDVVYFSTTQFAVLPLGRRWQEHFGVPFVIDLQDPWLSDYYERPGTKPPGGWKYRLAHRFAKTLEGWTLRRCAHVISVSPAYLKTLRRRYPWFGPASGSVLTFGAPDRDFALASEQARSRPPLLPQTGALRIAYAGRLGADMLPALAVLFAAVARARQRGARPIELFFFGTSYAAPGEGRGTTRELADAHGIADLVHETPDRIPYLDALRLLLETDVALLLGSEEAAYSPSKAHPTLLAAKPTLALMPRDSVLQNLLEKLGGTTLVPFLPGVARAAADNSVARLADALHALARGDTWAPDRPLERATIDREFSARAVAERQLEIFARVMKQTAGNHPHAAT